MKQCEATCGTSEHNTGDNAHHTTLPAHSLCTLTVLLQLLGLVRATCGLCCANDLEQRRADDDEEEEADDDGAEGAPLCLLHALAHLAALVDVLIELLTAQTTARLLLAGGGHRDNEDERAKRSKSRRWAYNEMQWSRARAGAVVAVLCELVVTNVAVGRGGLVSDIVIVASEVLRQLERQLRLMVGQRTLYHTGCCCVMLLRLTADMLIELMSCNQP